MIFIVEITLESQEYNFVFLMKYFSFALRIGTQVVAATFWQVSRPDGGLLQNSLFEALKVVGEPHISNNEAARLHPLKSWEVAILGLGWGWTWTRPVVVFFWGGEAYASNEEFCLHTCLQPISWAILSPCILKKSWTIYIYIYETNGPLTEHGDARCYQDVFVSPHASRHK